MGKSIIPFIFENPFLNNIFIEAASCTKASKFFCFQNFTLETIKINNLKILLTDHSSLRKIENQDIKLDSIFLVNVTNQINSNFFIMIGKGKNVKSIAYVDNLAFYIKECLELKEGIFEKNYTDEPNLSVNELVSISLNKLNKNKKFNIRIPYSIGLLGGYFFDFIS